MWPRGENASGPGADMTAARRNRNSGLSGFVSFMRRKDAEAALKEFDGFDWGGSVLRVGWSKAVPIAAKPMYGQWIPAVLLSFTKLSPIHQSPKDPALLARCQIDVDPVPVPVPVPVPAPGTVTVNIGAINVRVAVRIPLDVGLGIHAPQGDPTIAIRNVVVHLAIAVRHVEM
jgi:hypothetical protein